MSKLKKKINTKYFCIARLKKGDTFKLYKQVIDYKKVFIGDPFSYVEVTAFGKIGIKYSLDDIEEIYDLKTLVDLKKKVLNTYELYNNVFPEAVNKVISNRRKEHHLVKKAKLK